MLTSGLPVVYAPNIMFNSKLFNLREFTNTHVYICSIGTAGKLC